ncbi:hypothetical protein [Nocardia sp. NPDC057668]|uniref:hypothetical protein n=1 Tax=Nocardia sp. NPDC057668 TaxID=3346202 RepID=UPI00366FE584
MFSERATPRELWARMSPEARSEFDDLLTRGAEVQAVAALRRHVGEPCPQLRDCIDLLVERADELGHRLGERT